MNSYETKVGRRNQVLYCLGFVNSTTFKTSDIEVIFRKEFPVYTNTKNLNISKALSEIETYKETPIKRSSPKPKSRSLKGDSWIFTDNQYILCIRVMLMIKLKKLTVEKLADRLYKVWIHFFSVYDYVYDNYVMQGNEYALFIVIIMYDIWCIKKWF